MSLGTTILGGTTSRHAISPEPDAMGTLGEVAARVPAAASPPSEVGIALRCEPSPSASSVSSADTLPSDSRLAEATRRRDLVQAFAALVQAGCNRMKAARKLGESYSTLWRWQRDFSQHGFDGLVPDTHERGRKPAYQPTAAELAVVRPIYLKLDDSRKGGSVITAFRLAAKSDHPAISEAFRQVVLKRKSKSLPPSWRSLLEAPQNVIQHVRDRDSLSLNFITTPRGRTYVNAQGVELPIRCGTIMESDDGTFNFPAFIPWPFGGDKCSEKFGVRVGRWQLLPVVDVESLFCLSFDVVARSSSSYRGEDVMALFGRTFAEVGQPESLRLERGSWESEIVRGALRLAGVPVHNAWESKQKPAIEGFFDRLWTPASLIPGHVGRDRGRFAENNALLMACQDGRKDPREHFLSLEDAIQRVIGAIQFVNSEPIESRAWGRWIPQERWQDQTGRQPLATLDPSLRIFFSREQKVWTVRGCLLGGNVSGPQVSFPVYFQCQELWEFEGCKIKAFFDPYSDPCLGTLVLQDEWRGYKPGHIIARDVPALDLPPQIVLAADGWSGEEKYKKSLEIRKAISKAVRTESWNWLGKRTSEARDGRGNISRVERGAPRRDESAGTAHTESLAGSGGPLRIATRDGRQISMEADAFLEASVSAARNLGGVSVDDSAKAQGEEDFMDGIL